MTYDGTILIKQPKKAMKGKIEVVHSWKTGYQELIFNNLSDVFKWAKSENCQVIGYKL